VYAAAALPPAIQSTFASITLSGRFDEINNAIGIGKHQGGRIGS